MTSHHVPRDDAGNAERQLMEGTYGGSEMTGALECFTLLQQCRLKTYNRPKMHLADRACQQKSLFGSPRLRSPTSQSIKSPQRRHSARSFLWRLGAKFIQSGSNVRLYIAAEAAHMRLAYASYMSTEHQTYRRWVYSLLLSVVVIQNEQQKLSSVIHAFTLSGIRHSNTSTVATTCMAHTKTRHNCQLSLTQQQSDADFAIPQLMSNTDWIRTGTVFRARHLRIISKQLTEAYTLFNIQRNSTTDIHKTATTLTTTTRLGFRLTKSLPVHCTPVTIGSS